MRSRKTTDGLLRSERNLMRYAASARPAIIAFVKQKAAEFRAEGGRFSRYTLFEWQALRPALETEVDEVMAAMGFEQ